MACSLVRHLSMLLMLTLASSSPLTKTCVTHYYVLPSFPVLLQLKVYFVSRASADGSGTAGNGRALAAARNVHSLRVGSWLDCFTALSTVCSALLDFHTSRHMFTHFLPCREGQLGVWLWTWSQQLRRQRQHGP